jgi:hypothetical protein
MTAPKGGRSTDCAVAAEVGCCEVESRMDNFGDG